MVSVIVPSYNAVLTLEACIRGLINQTQPKWQALFINDGSSDGTHDLLNHWARVDSRIEVQHFEQNRGVVAARNAGLEWAQGDWVAFCDADDQWLPVKLEQQMALVDNHDFICSSYWEHKPGKTKRLISTTGRISYQGLLVTNPIPFSTAMLRRSKLCGLRFEELPAPYIHEDYAFWLRLFKSGQLKAVYVKEPLVNRIVDQNSRSFDKLLGARSHNYVLKTVAEVRQTKRFVLMLLYVWNAVLKKMVKPLLK